MKIIRPGDDANSPTIQFSYSTYGVGNPFHIQLSQKLATGSYANFVRYYNGLGQVIQAQTVGAVLETGTYNVVSDSWYDAYGQAVRQFVPYTYVPQPGEPYTYTQPLTLPYSTITTYDPLGRPQSMTDPAGVSVQYTYKDLETRLTNGKGNTTRTLYDIWGRVSQVIPLNGDNNASPAGPAISYSYDDLDRLTTVWQGTQISTTLTYDFAGRKIAMNDPDMGDWTYTYNYLGSLTQQTDARGCVTTLSYDLINRLTQKSFGTGCTTTPTVTYSYDDDLNGNYGKGLRTGMSDASGSASWKYDARGQLQFETKVIGSSNTFKTEWNYNSAGMLNYMRYPLNASGAPGEQVMYSYLPQMTLDSVYVGTAPGNPIYVQGTEYDSAGRATLRTLGSGANAVQTRYNYYQWNTSINGGKLQQIYTTRGTTPLQNFQYAYDSNANITTIHDYIMGSPQTQTFGYDNLDRLTSAQASGGTQGNYGPEGYTYDAATGNLTTKNGATYDYGAQSAECDLPGLDKAHAAVSAGSNKSYCYDQNGNMVRRKIDNVIYTLTYDSENHMTGYSGGSVNATFVYDGDGRRVQSTVNGVTTQFVGSHVEWKTSTTDMVRYYYAGGVRVAMRTGDTGLVWLVGDHLGSTSIAVTDSSGATERQGYKAWGEFRFGSLPTKYQFTGQRNEPEIGLYYYGARWYDSDLARFAQADTIIPDPYNSLDYDRYQYVRSNPIRFNDPTGHFRDCPLDQPCDDIDLSKLPVLIVDYVSVNQYGFGRNSCGIVAGLYAGGDRYAMRRAAEKYGFTEATGIQPKGLAKALREVYGDENVEEHNSLNPYEALGEMYEALKSGKVVIVDILVHQDENGVWQVGDGEGSLAHFARVVGFDFANGLVILDNSLSSSGKPWVITIEEFILAWYNPEIRAKKKPGGVKLDEVDYWWVAITPPTRSRNNYPPQAK